MTTNVTPQRIDHPLGRRAIGAAVPVAHVFGVDVFAHWSLVIVPFAILAAVPAMFGAFSALGFVFNTVDEVANLANVTVPSEQGVIR